MTHKDLKNQEEILLTGLKCFITAEGVTLILDIFLQRHPRKHGFKKMTFLATAGFTLLYFTLNLTL